MKNEEPTPLTEVNNTGTVNVEYSYIKSHELIDFSKLTGYMNSQNHFLRGVDVFTTKTGKKFWVKNEGNSQQGPWGTIKYTSTWTKFANTGYGGDDLVSGYTFYTETPEICQQRCDSEPKCKSIMWATDENPNQYYRHLCWLKTEEPMLTQTNHGTGLDTYVRKYPAPPTLSRMMI